MLTQVKDIAQIDSLLRRFAGGFASGYVLRNFCFASSPGEPGPILLAEQHQPPRAMAAHHGVNFMLAALDQAAYEGLLSDIFQGRIEQDPPWPDDTTTAHWAAPEGRRGIFLNSCPAAAHDAALGAGFLPQGGKYDNTVAHLWHVTGEPRLASLVRHSCRLGRGDELLELLRQGIDYDPEGDYLRQILKLGPSFVCEDDGKPVSWSCTHMNQTMGMIYTPPENRRKGYARSLTAFQVDHMLRHYGIACAHVISTNDASRRLLEGLGARMVDAPLVWRQVYWPD
ncbi:GNAT family N-acetyltransferase [bacterium]|nr:GNAT family N-acetyltransferase [bacterium]